jgi:thiosulfate/3-mercaptopyruvate sulfurtransferase
MRRWGFGILAIGVTGVFLACLMFGLRTQSAAGKAAISAPAAAQATSSQVAGAGKAAELPAAVQIEPKSLAELLGDSKRQKPVVLHVGFKNFYDQAKIPGSDYAGPGSKPDGLELLRKRVSSLQHKQLIVLYCGCCPWDKCPNAKPAYEALHALGFTNVKVVHIAENFGADWVNAGLPTTKGE